MLSWLKSSLYALIDLVSLVLHPLSRLLGRDRVRVLCYHRVCDLPDTKDFVGHVAVSPREFARQMALLSQNGFNVITMDELIEYRESNGRPPPRTVVITFDDGYRDNFVNAFPILEQHHLKATFFLVTDYIDSNRVFHWLKLENRSLAHSRENQHLWSPLTTQDILAMSSGASFGSHGKSHRSLGDADESTAREELEDSKARLEELTSRPVACFSYPHGEWNDSVKELAKAAGYKAALTNKPGANNLSSDFFELRRTAISRRDSYARFKRKVEGAYDWPLYLVDAVRSAQRLIPARAGKSDDTADNLQKV